MLKIKVLAGTAFTLLSACASIDRGLNDHVRIDTVPQGATVSVYHIPFKDNVRHPGAIERATCDATPCAIEVRRSQRGVVAIEKDGFETAQYFFGPSRYRAGGNIDLTPSPLAVTTGSLGAGLSLGVTYAAYSQAAAGIGNALTFGLGNFQGASYAAGTGVGVGLAVGSMLIDSGSGANLNIYPNPVVIGLAPDGTVAADDPFVDHYYTLMRAYTQKERSCSQRTKRDETITCSDANRRYRDAKTALMDLEDERDKALKALLDAQKDAQPEDEAAQ